MSVTINASTSAGLIQTADTSGTVEIQSNGSTKLTVASTGAYGQLVSGTVNGGAANPLSGGTTVDFTGIPSWVKRITISVNAVSVSGTSAMLIQLGDSGGVETTGYSGIRASTDVNNVAVASTFTAGLCPMSYPVSTDTGSGIITFTNPNGNVWVGSGVLVRNGTTGALFTSSTVKTLSDTLDRVRITTINGTDTFDAGSINILYEG
jgi:hypothetical protein